MQLASDTKRTFTNPLLQTSRDQVDDGSARQLSAGANRTNAVLDSFAAALFVVQRDRRVELINSAGRRIVGERDFLALLEGHLCGIRSVVTQRLGQALDVVCGLVRLKDAFGVTGVRDGSTLQVSVSMLTCSADCNPPLSRLALIVAERSCECGHDEATLGLLFGLSHSEAAILKGLLTRKTLEQCARSRGVALSTARSQLKSIFRKTNTSSQVQLMVVAKALPVIHGRA